MSYSRRRLKEVVTLQKGILERIEADLGEFGFLPRLKYIQEFADEFQAYEAPCPLDEIVERAAGTNLVYIGDYHPLTRSREFVDHFLRQLVLRKPAIVLGVEVIFSRHQKLFERWFQGKLPEAEFLARIRYSEEWGCDWPSYRRLFEAARQLGIPVCGVDCHPRRDLRSIRRRDQGVARRIAKLVQEDPSRTVVVLFGESHLAASHLPLRVRRILEKRDMPLSDLILLQNVDGLYWQLQQRGREGVQAVRMRQNRYCVFNATPLEKYESFRQYLSECAGEHDASGDWTRFVHTLIEGMFDFLDIEKRANLVDYLPKVYSEIPAAQLPDFLAQHQIRTSQVRSIVDSLQRSGASYIPELNSMFIDRFNLDSAAEETARFIYYACRGELQVAAERAAMDLFFVRVIERALGYFCSKLLHSSRDGIEDLGERVLNYMGYNDDFARTVPFLIDPEKKPSVAHFEKLRATIEQHAGRHKLIGMLSMMLGYALGRRLYRAYLESRISRKDIQALFHDRLAAPEDALLRYVELNNRLS